MILTMEYGKSMKYALIFIFAALLSEGESSVRILRHQQIKRFHCINDHYILSSWFCDGFDDCGDFSDEAYGCSDLCGIGNFTCQDGTCLPISVRCDVAKDCADGSDELFCDHEPDFKECTIPNGKFLCKDKLRCVELSHVCDGEYHCFDYSDENSKCDDYDHEICNLCFEGCYRTPDGPFCLYNGTFEKPAEAAYITKCAFSENDCQQSCILFKGVKQCSCEENFIPVYTSEYETFYCEEKDKSKNMLVYATNKGEIRAIPGYANYTISIRKFGQNITALAAGNENVYWAILYAGYHFIGKSSFSGNDTKVIVSNGIGEVRAMDVDWRTGNIYFIDNIKKHIAACTASGSRCIEVKSLDNVATSIALAPKYGSMFWSVARNEEYGFSIMKAHMNGLWSSTFLEGGLRDVSVISIDEAARKLYWLDAVHRKISVAGFDSSRFSSGRRVFKSDIRMNYLSLAANAQYLYWIIRNNGTIFFTPQVRVSVGYALNGTDPVQHIYGYSYSEKTTKMEAPCSWGCEDGICLIHSLRFNRTGSTCICNGSEIDSTGIWCRNNSRYYVNNNYVYFYHIPSYTSKVTEPHRTLLIVLCFVAIASAIVFYLYRKGFFNDIKLLPIGKFSLMNNMET